MEKKYYLYEKFINLDNVKKVERKKLYRIFITFDLFRIFLFIATIVFCLTGFQFNNIRGQTNLIIDLIILVSSLFNFTLFLILSMQNKVFINNFKSVMLTTIFIFLSLVIYAIIIYLSLKSGADDSAYADFLHQYIYIILIYVFLYVCAHFLVYKCLTEPLKLEWKNKVNEENNNIN